MGFIPEARISTTATGRKIQDLIGYEVILRESTDAQPVPVVGADYAMCVVAGPPDYKIDDMGRIEGILIENGITVVMSDTRYPNCLHIKLPEYTIKVECTAP